MVLMMITMVMWMMCTAGTLLAEKMVAISAAVLMSEVESIIASKHNSVKSL